MQTFEKYNKKTPVMISCQFDIELRQNKNWVLADTGLSKELNEGNIIDANLGNYIENKSCQTSNIFLWDYELTDEGNYINPVFPFRHSVLSHITLN